MCVRAPAGREASGGKGSPGLSTKTNENTNHTPPPPPKPPARTFRGRELLTVEGQWHAKGSRLPAYDQRVQASHPPPPPRAAPWPWAEQRRQAPVCAGEGGGRGRSQIRNRASEPGRTSPTRRVLSLKGLYSLASVTARASGYRNGVRLQVPLGPAAVSHSTASIGHPPLKTTVETLSASSCRKCALYGRSMNLCCARKAGPAGCR